MRGFGKAWFIYMAERNFAEARLGEARRGAVRRGSARLRQGMVPFSNHFIRRLG